MNRFRRGIAWGMAAVLTFDTIGSIASLVLGFEYSVLTFGSTVIYGCIGAYVGIEAGVKRAVVAALCVGAVDLTIGWAISWWIGPGRVQEPSMPISSIVVSAMISMAISSAGSGAVGAWLARRIGGNPVSAA